MIVMVISDAPGSERAKILASARSQAAYHSDDYWKFIESGSVDELRSSVQNEDKIDMICLDITMNDAIHMAERLRSIHTNAYFTLIADDTISPVKYIKPTIRADSLMIKPLDTKQLDDVLGESVSTYIRRLDRPEGRKVFIAENKGERNLIDYSRILFFESREKKVFLSTEREEYGFYDTLDELEKKLDESFLRCHRSYIVNTDRITGIEISASVIHLDDGTDLPLSRSYKPAVREYLGKRKMNGNR